MVKREFFSLTETKKETQTFIMTFILVLRLAVNPEPKVFSLRVFLFWRAAKHPKVIALCLCKWMGVTSM